MNKSEQAKHDEVMPCPFCGKQPEFSSYRECDDRRYVKMELECCVIMSQSMGWSEFKNKTDIAITEDLKAELTHEWNRRAQPTAIAQLCAKPDKPFPAPGEWFPVGVLGHPMREYEPGKWESADWPSDDWSSETKPVPLVLYCPECGAQHVDAGEWATRPHKTHQCQSCKAEWRPFLYATVGVIDNAIQAKPDSAEQVPVAFRIPNKYGKYDYFGCNDTVSSESLAVAQPLYAAAPLNIPSRDSAEQVPTAWAIEANTAINQRAITSLHLTEDEARQWEKAAQAKYAGCERKAIPLYASPLNIAQQAPKHQEFSDRYKVVKSAFWWQIQIGDGIQKIGKFYTEVEAMRMASELLRTFRDGEFVAEKSIQSQLSQAQEDNAQLKAALERISRPANYACGCSFPCRCDCPEAEVINAQMHRDIAIQALEGK